MKQGGRAHELARSRIVIGVDCNTPATPQACPRLGILSEHPPTLSFEEKDGVSVLGQPTALFCPDLLLGRNWDAFPLSNSWFSKKSTQLAVT